MIRAGRLLGGAALLAAAGCRPDCTPPAGQVRPNVVLVTVDTLRADHLGCYGNTVVRTPNLDRLAEEGTRFDRCWAETHVTVPSHLSILSSVPPAVHGVLTNDRQAARPIVALPALFRHAGYRTGAFVGAKHLGPEWTLGPLLADSLDTWDAPRRMSVPHRARETNAELFRWLRAGCARPFFAWVHYWDPHMPYEPPPPFDTAYFNGDPYDPQATSMEGVAYGWFFYDLGGIRRLFGTRSRDVRDVKRELGVRTKGVRQLVLYPDGLRDLPIADERRAALRARLGDVAAFLRRRLPLRQKLSDWLTGVRDLRYPLARYAGEVSYVDQEIGRLRAELERLRIADRTVLVVTADHGESLGEHGLYFDHYGLGEANLRVPLIFWGARVPRARRPDPAAGVDVAPTVLRLAGLPVPPGMRGRDLARADGSSEPLVAESADGVQLALREGPWKLLRTSRRFYYLETLAGDAGSTELYDLDADPGERTDVAARTPDVAARLGTRLDAWVAANRPSAEGPPAAAPSPEQERELRALGYVE